MRKPPVIDHDPNEPKKPYKPVSWLLIWAIIAFGWAGYLLTEEFNWYPIALGLGTGTMLATWAIEVTGNKVPDSWRRKSPNRDRDI